MTTTTGAVNENSDGRSDHALHVAQFLTMFQSHFTGKPGPPITVEDLEHAIDYRLALERHEWLQHEQQNSTSAPPTAPERCKQINFLLRRFEIWSTKALANHCLLNCCKSRNSDHQTERICSSTLLNIPGAMHFSKILPALPVDSTATSSNENDKKNHACGLPLPPNSATWNEYFKMARMVSLLPTPRECFTSPLTGVSVKLQPVKEDALKMGENSRLTQTDLVALWIRAQRNTSALRHLLHLFTVREVQPKRKWKIAGRIQAGGRSIGKRIVREELEEEDDGKKCKKPTFVAQYVGNHRNTRKRVTGESHLVDQLVEWAVANQVLFTFHYVREALKCSSKRKHTANVESHGPPTKRARVDTENAWDDENELRPEDYEDGDLHILRACQCYILRWFARRNRKDLAILFNVHPDTTQEVSSSCRLLVLDLVSQKVPKKIRKYMQEYGSKMRTLARIDRHVAMGLFDDSSEDPAKTFYGAVTDLLNAFITCAPQEITMRIAEAVNDFERLHNYMQSLYKDKGARAVAQALTNGAAEYNIAELLLSSPAPWMDHCVACEKVLEKAPDRVCVNCEDARHETCCSNDPVQCKLKDIVLKCPPLKKLYNLRIPRYLMTPDFTESGRVTFTTHVLDLKRQVLKKIKKSGGKELSPLGMGIRQTEQCEEFLRSYLAQDTLACDTMDSKVAHYPLAVSHTGVLVVDVVKEAAAQKAGIQKSDIITNLEFLGKENRAKHDFSKASIERRKELLRKPVEVIRLTVQRPDIDLVEASQQWFRNVHKANNPAADVLKSGGRDFYVCPDCRVDSCVQEETQEARIEREATYCRAIIRHMGMEWCSLPFHDENPNIGDQKRRRERDNDESSSRHERHVSLRRLDAMMGCIISKNSRDHKKRRFSNNADWLVDPFTIPPWGTEGVPGERLQWAPSELESKPLELLCRGMELILTGSHDMALRSNLRKDERAALTSTFASLVSAWCWASSDGGATVQTCGPPPSALQATEPWLQQGCAVCAVRPRGAGDGKSSTLGICNNEKCRQLFENQQDVSSDMSDTTPEVASGESSDEDSAAMDIEDGGTQEDCHGPEEECDSEWFMEIPRSCLDKQIREYEHCSSFVGTSLLVLPGDPYLEYVSRELNMSIDHMDRPMELLVVSYLPPGFVKDGNKNGRTRIPGNQDGKRGFRVIPILQQHQLQIVWSRCQMRQPPNDPYTEDRSWTELDVLNLQGVIWLSYTELQKKLQETEAIRSAIDEAVAKVAMCSSSREIQFLKESMEADEIGVQNSDAFILPCRSVMGMSKSTKRVQGAAGEVERNLWRFEDCEFIASDVFHVSRGSMAESSSDSRGGVITQYSVLVDCLLRSAVPLVRSLVASVNTWGENQAEHNSEILLEQHILGPDDDTDIEESDCESTNTESPILNRRGSHRTGGATEDNAAEGEGARNLSRPISGVQPYFLKLPRRLRDLCFLCYSDFLLGSESGSLAEAFASLKWALQGQKLVNPPLHDASSVKHITIILQRVSGEGSEESEESEESGFGAEVTPRGYTGVGWGFELVRWKSEKGLVRVGRVHPDSVAAEAGLQMNDIIFSINQKRIETFSNATELARAILCRQSKGSVESSTPGSFVTNIGHPVSGPVVLKVYRPWKEIATETQGINGNYDVQKSCKKTIAPMDIANRSRPEERQVRNQAPNSPMQGATANAGPSLLENQQMQPPSPHEHNSHGAVTTLAPNIAIGPRQEQQLATRAAVAPPAYEQQFNTEAAVGSPCGSAQNECEISSIDLFQPGLDKSFLSRVETAFLIEANRRNCPKLGLRLLLPRYQLGMLEYQLDFILKSDYSSIPRVQDQLWAITLKYDFERSTKEEGPIVFHEGEYRYQYPHGILPLDRITESFLRRTKTGRARLMNGQSTHREIMPDREQYRHAQTPSLMSGREQPRETAQLAPFSEAQQVEAPPVQPGFRLCFGPQSLSEGNVLHQNNARELDFLPPPTQNRVTGSVACSSSQDAAIRKKECRSCGPERGSISYNNALSPSSPPNASIANGPTARDAAGPQVNVPNPLSSILDENLKSHGDHLQADKDGLRHASGFWERKLSRPSTGLQADVPNPLSSISDENRRSHGDNMQADIDGLPHTSGFRERNLSKSSIGIAVSHEGSDCVTNESSGNLASRPSLAPGEVVCSAPGDSGKASIGTSASSELYKRGGDKTSPGHRGIVIDVPSSGDEESVPQVSYPHRGVSNSLRIRGGGALDNNGCFDRATYLNHESSPKRIRGGGINKEGSEALDEETTLQRLDEFPSDSWDNRPVFGVCSTTKDGSETGEAKFIGIVIFPVAHETQEENVDVCVIYVSNIGLLAKEMYQQFRPCHLCVVQSGSKEASVIEDWQSKREQQSSEEMDGVQKPNNKSFGDSPNQTHDANRNAELPTVGNETLQRLAKEEAAHSLLKRLCHRRSTTSPLGELPDGRAVLWLQSDPRALYLRADVESPKGIVFDERCDSRQHQYKAQTRREGDSGNPSVLRARELESHCCVWGCSRGVEGTGQRRLLSFNTRSELVEHISLRHSFGVEFNKIHVGGEGQLVRVAEGPNMTKLGVDLTSSICALCPSLIKLARSNSISEPCETGRHPSSVKSTTFCFDMEMLLNLTKEGRGAPKRLREIIGSSMKFGENLRQLVRLWSRIARLFDVEGNGLFRLEPAKCRTMLISSGGLDRNAVLAESRDTTGIDQGAIRYEVREDPEAKETGGEAETTKYCCSSETTVPAKSIYARLSCTLCSSVKDAVLCVDGPAQSNDAAPSPVPSPVSYSGIGCALLTECCFSSEESPEVFDNIAFAPGRLSMAKTLLARVASNVPPGLRRESTTQRTGPKVAPGVNPLESCEIWEDTQFKTWLAFVQNSKDVRMLAQAFLMLALSVHHRSMPRWWRLARAGWYGAYALVSTTSLSSLMLQLYVFDAAVAEFNSMKHSFSRKSKGGISNAYAEQLNQMSNTGDRMGMVMKWAEAIDWEPFRGANNEFCDMCGDGGHLLCCEFCKNVRHLECCHPPLFEDPTYKWICDGCIGEITTTKDCRNL